MLNAPKQTQRTLPPAGTHIARCIGLIQIGSIRTEYLGEEKWLEKIRLTFELPLKLNVFRDGEEKKPFVVSKECTLSMGDKSILYPLVRGIFGDIPEEVRNTFDIESLLDQACLVTITHEESKNGKYAQIVSTSPLMEGMEAPKAINQPKLLTYEKWDKDYFNSLPDFIKDKMKGSKQYQKHFGPDERVEENIDPNDIPF